MITLSVLCLVMEVWKPIDGYESYLVSNFGRVLSLDKTVNRRFRGNLPCKGTNIRPSESTDGYLRVNLSGKTRKKCIGIHRLVAQAFIPNPSYLPQVNHRNEIKTDNRVENLEWCDSSYNINYGTRNLKLTKWLYEQYSLSGEFLRAYTPTELANSGFDRGNCRAVALNKRNTYKGFVWKLKPLEV